MTTTNLLPASIELRAMKMIENGMDILEAVKAAILEENRMIDSCLADGGFLSAKGKVANEYTANKFYNRVNGK